jgi:glycogen debranching enzyme
MLASEFGDDEAERHWSERADALKAAFNERFWLPDRGWYALALDGDKRPVDALASNMGHCLWSGIVDDDKAAQVAERLMAAEMFSGWGVRTLATTMGAYHPMSYHNGSVWPHDNALIATGLMRYGKAAAAQRIATAMLDAAECFGGRLPELFCGFDRADYGQPVPFPTSCSPQAWAAAAPLQLLRTLLQLDPCLPHGRVLLAPRLPPGIQRLGVDNLPINGYRASFDVDGERVVRVDGLPPDVRVSSDARRFDGRAEGRPRRR